jgi:NitT/TauT family transport system ATP-binding protein
MIPSGAPETAAAWKDGRPRRLEIRHLDKTFTVNGRGTTVLSDIDITIESGELVCLVGRSGCGKSTLLNILAGFLSPTRGDVRLNGREISRPGTDRCVVFQEDALFPWLTVAENIAFGLRGSRRNIKEKVARFLALVDLSAFGHYLPREISGGMKQRVALARVLILEPQVLLMDEPFGALDAQTRMEMHRLLLDLWTQWRHTILFVTHDVQEAAALADRILLMGKGPGRIHEDIRVDLPRPRRSDTPAFLDLTQRLLKNLG